VSVVIFKPDEIGDVVIATGAIRLLADAHGEENTTIVVKSELAPLVRREFPKARVLELPWQPRRKGRNQAVANLQHCYPVWRELRGLRADLVVCLRSARDCLQTILFLAPRAKRRVAAENVLLRNGKPRRQLLEFAVRSLWRTELLPYPPAPGELSCEVASHRLVVEACLGRPVPKEEISPRISSASRNPAGYWLICPLSSREIKNYSAERWLEALARTSDLLPSAIRVAGSSAQSGELGKFVAVLRSGNLGCPVEQVPPAPLADFPDLVAGAELVLAVDTAAAHFACALDVPAVIVDSGNNPGVYGPNGRPERQVWLTADRKKFGRLRWQETLPPDLVAEAVRRALSFATRL